MRYVHLIPQDNWKTYRTKVWVYEFCICTQISSCTYARVCMYSCMHACMHACMYVCMYVSLYWYACMYVCMCVCMYVCMYVLYVCMYVCMYACVCMYECIYIQSRVWWFVGTSPCMSMCVCGGGGGSVFCKVEQSGHALHLFRAAGTKMFENYQW